MKIFLDFDDTILNTGAFMNEIMKVFISAGFSQEEFRDNWEETKVKTGDFDLDVFFNLFVRTGEFDIRKTRKSMDMIFSNIDVFVHDDFFDFVKEFGKDKLAILSFGTTPFQREKIENSKIVPYFSEVIVTPKGKEEAFLQIVSDHAGKKIFFVDDRAYQINKVKEAFPDITAMKIERPNGRYREDKSAFADYIVKDFYDVADIIKGNR